MCTWQDRGEWRILTLAYQSGSRPHLRYLYPHEADNPQQLPILGTYWFGGLARVAAAQVLATVKEQIRARLLNMATILASYSRYGLLDIPDSPICRHVAAKTIRIPGFRASELVR